MILDTIAPVIPHLRHVTIDEAQLREVCAHLPEPAPNRALPATLRLPAWDDDVFILHPPEARAAQLLLFNTINFSYWGEPKWTIEFHGRPLDGAWGMLGALARAVDEGFPLFDGAYLATIPESDARHVLRGNVEVPMFQERLDILHEVGHVLAAQFGGKFDNLIHAAGNDAVALVRLLVTRFPSFNDVATLCLPPRLAGGTEGGRGGFTVAFYKRAQLAAAMLYEAFGGEGPGDLRHAEQLTVFADYKLPQVLRRLSILHYAPHLAGRVDRREPLEAGSREEVEIRAATVWAGELMRQALVSRFPQVTALHIDYWLWREGQRQGPDVRPYHRTRTIYY
ncbi:MAG: queuosine salvage family protein [Anaerolineae bacterium]